MNDNMTQQRKIEILAPAGSYESFLAAVHAGADAVYAGGPRFGARAFAENFTGETLLQAIDYAHLHGRRFYLTVNTLFKDSEICDLYDYLYPLYLQGLDAVIVQDAGAVQLIRDCFPLLPIHASTQMTITGAGGAAFMKAQGITRVVPARELSLSEVQQIAEETGLEVECFVHGALCYCYSGQCLLSSLIGGRSGNRGQCAQPCRLPYTFEGKKAYLLSMKDICTLDLIPELVQAGICSFKIEGRMKKPEYVAGVTAMYRKYTDLYLKNGRSQYKVEARDREMLMDLYNRGGFHDGYYHKHNGKEMLSLNRPNHAGVPAFQVLSQKGRDILGQALTELNKGDILEFTDQKENYTFGKSIKKGAQAAIIGPKGTFWPKGTIFYRTRNQLLLDQLSRPENFTDSKVKISGRLKLTVSRPAELTVSSKSGIITENGGIVSVTVFTDEKVQEAIKQPLEKERIQKQLMKTGNTEFVFDALDIQIQGDVFLSMPGLNELRRQALEQLKKQICQKAHRCPVKKADSNPGTMGSDFGIPPAAPECPKLFALTETPEQLRAVLSFPNVKRIYAESSSWRELSRQKALLENACSHGIEIYLVMPHIFRQEAKDLFEENYEEIMSLARNGVLIRNYESYQFLKAHGFDKSIRLDHNLYVFNQFGKKFWNRNGISGFTAPVELNRKELGKLGIQSAEMIIYGRIPVMISAQCITKTCSECQKTPKVHLLEDRYHKKFPVKNQCAFCYNVIYNSAPLNLFDQKAELEELKPDGYRIQFSIENGQETADILRKWTNGGNDFSDTDFTRGHFKRGIT